MKSGGSRFKSRLARNVSRPIDIAPSTATKDTPNNLTRTQRILSHPTPPGAIGSREELALARLLCRFLGMKAITKPHIQKRTCFASEKGSLTSAHHTSWK